MVVKHFQKWNSRAGNQQSKGFEIVEFAELKNPHFELDESGCVIKEQNRFYPCRWWRFCN
jgi:hypothetical protein